METVELILSIPIMIVIQLFAMIWKIAVVIAPLAIIYIAIKLMKDKRK